MGVCAGILPLLNLCAVFGSVVTDIDCQAREFVNQLDISTTAVEIYHTT